MILDTLATLIFTAFIGALIWTVTHMSRDDFMRLIVSAACTLALIWAVIHVSY